MSNIKGMPQVIPWYILDLSNKQLITSPTVPRKIRDQKGIILGNIKIPGKNHSPIQYMSGDNRKISFSIDIIKKNNTVGNTLQYKQFENLRNQAVGLTGIFSSQFTANPKVLYAYGTNSIPLEYYVRKCDMSNQWFNEMGNVQYTTLDMELELDEESLLYKAEEVYRKVSSLLGMADSMYSMYQHLENNRSPFK